MSNYNFPPGNDPTQIDLNKRKTDPVVIIVAVVVGIGLLIALVIIASLLMSGPTVGNVFSNTVRQL